MQSIIHRCLAYRHAYQANILHHDLSPENIIIDEKGNGLLIDWDLSKPVALNGEETPRCATRTVSNDYLFPVMINANPENGFQGTWQFMSTNLIMHLDAWHEFIDDLESSLYVLLWMVILYSPVTPKNRVPPFLATFLVPSLMRAWAPPLR
jgi:serine/threonine protein kinase